MSRRSGRKPLYEVVRSGLQVPAVGGTSTENDLAGGGRAVRIPVGLVMLAGAGAIMLIILAYMGGYKHAESTLRQEFEERTLGSDGLFNPGQGDLTDPLNANAGDSRGPGAGPRQPQAGDENGTAGGIRPGGRAAAGGGGEPGWGPLQSDPRVAGLNYLRLLQGDNVDEAVKVATFCREHGLEAYVLIGDNGRFARVIASPGFSDASSPEAIALQTRVKEVGQRLRADRVSSSDFHDCFFSLYTG